MHANGKTRKSDSGLTLKPPNAEAPHLSLKPVYDSPASQTRRISAHMVRQRSLNNPHWTQKFHKKPTYDKGLKTRIETSLQLIRALTRSQHTTIKTRIETSLQLIRALIEFRLHFTSKPISRLRPFPNASPAFATAGGRRSLLDSSLLYSSLLYPTLLYYSLRYSTLLFSTLLYSSLLFYSLLFSILYSTLCYSTLLSLTLLFSVSSIRDSAISFVYRKFLI